MILTLTSSNYFSAGVPRVGGGDPHELGDLVELDTCSPRRRG